MDSNWHFEIWKKIPKIYPYFSSNKTPGLTAPKNPFFFYKKPFVAIRNWRPQSQDLNIHENLRHIFKEILEGSLRTIEALLIFSQLDFSKNSNPNLVQTIWSFEKQWLSYETFFQNYHIFPFIFSYIFFRCRFISNWGKESIVPWCIGFCLQCATVVLHEETRR